MNEKIYYYYYYKKNRKMVGERGFYRYKNQK